MTCDCQLTPSTSRKTLPKHSTKNAQFRCCIWLCTQTCARSSSSSSSCYVLLLLVTELVLPIKKSPLRGDSSSSEVLAEVCSKLSLQLSRSNTARIAAVDRMQCQRCQAARAVVKRPKDGSRVCRECFFALFEEASALLHCCNALL
jgi:hypothetical protein